MIINLVDDSTDGSGGNYYVYTQTIPSQTTTKMFGSTDEDKTMYDSVWQLSFDITYPIEIAGQSFATWDEFAVAATEYYITTDKQHSGMTGSYDSVTVTRAVTNGFKAYNVYAAPINTDSVTFPEFKFVLVAKF